MEPERQGSGLSATNNREPVIVAEQPAREVTAGDVRQTSGGQDEADLGEPGQSGPERGTAGWGTAGQNSAAQDGSDGWSSPMDAPPREDRWSDTGDKPYLGSPWEPAQSGPEYAPERIMAPAQMTAGRYISRPRLLRPVASRRRGRRSREQARASRERDRRLPSDKSEPAEAGAANTRPSIRPNTSLTARVPGKE
ncbi:MAG: hypothetical protein ACLR0U_18535 [Enterocloster clostridioformis]